MTEIALDLLDDLEETQVRDDLDREHVTTLIEVLDQAPPIEVVDLGNGRYGVVAGYHRREAARRRGQEAIHAKVLGIPREKWLEHALVSNAAHGKPLTLAERKRNAEALATGGYSARRIAAICGLNHETVAPFCPTGENRQLDTRESADGRRRPATREDAGARREQVVEFFGENPDASARQAAEETGVSPTTAADVKKRITEERPVDPVEDEALPPFTIQMPDGTNADAGTEEGNAAARELIADAEAAKQEAEAYEIRRLGKPGGLPRDYHRSADGQHDVIANTVMYLESLTDMGLPGDLHPDLSSDHLIVWADSIANSLEGLHAFEQRLRDHAKQEGKQND